MSQGPDQVPPNTTPVDPEVLRTPEEGLHPGIHVRKRVAIIGGGLAGLVAAFELKREGHQVTVLEAQNRVGGRIYTLREPFAPLVVVAARPERTDVEGRRFERLDQRHVVELRVVRQCDDRGVGVGPELGDHVVGHARQPGDLWQLERRVILLARIADEDLEIERLGHLGQHARQLPGVRFVPVTIQPYYAAYKEEVIGGAQLYFTDPAHAPLTAINFHAMEALKQVAGRDLFEEAVKANKKFSMFDKVNGTDATRLALQAGTPAANIVASWKAGEDAFRQLRQKYLLY